MRRWKQRMLLRLSVLLFNWAHRLDTAVERMDRLEEFDLEGAEAALQQFLKEDR